MSPKKKKKSNNKIIGVLLLLTIALIIAYALYKVISLIAVPSDVVVIENGLLTSEESTVGYVIREEQIVKGTNTQNGIYKIKAEGEKVAKGEELFRYYASNEESLNNNIDELNKKIQEAMLGQTDLLPADVNAIEKQIEDKIEGLNKKNNIQEISENKKDINTYTTKKSKIAGELSPAGSYIKGLIDEREKFETELKQNSEYVNSPMSGVVSYRVDNLEEDLKKDKFEDLSKKMLENLDLKTGQIVATSNEFGKVINNYECYIATILESKEAKEATVGKRVSLRLSTQEEIRATISYIKEEDDNSVLVIFKINDCVEKLIDYRKISIDVIWWKYDGLKAPKSVIIYENGLSYVVRNRGGYYSKILVKILKESNTYCIIDNYDTEELRNMGYSSDEIRNMKQISIYDQIVINPDIED